MTHDELVRKLRDLRRLERRLAGGDARGLTPVWDEYFSLSEGTRVRYPFRMMLIFDRAFRERAIREYLLALWVRAGCSFAHGEHDQKLLDELRLPADADSETVRRAFRHLALELHPDLGGDEELMRDLIDRYRRSSYGARP